MFGVGGGRALPTGGFIDMAEKRWQPATQAALEREGTWEIDGLKYNEVIAQVYGINNAVISGGIVEGHAVDTVYFRFERGNDPNDEVFVILRPDEMAALAWVCSGVLYSKLIEGDHND